MIALASLSILFANAQIGNLEGRLYPVTSRATITHIDAVDATHVRVWGRATRLRDCSFEGLRWYYGTRKNRVLVAMTFEEGTRLRPTGQMDFGPWLIQLTPAQLQNRSFAVATHRCHWLWRTRTVFY